MKQEHVIFVEEFVKTGDRKQAYKVAYGADIKEGTVNTNSKRLLRTPAIVKAIDARRELIINLAKEDLHVKAEEIVAEVLTLSQKRDILYKIATGQLLQERVMPVTVYDAEGNPSTQFKRVQMMPSHLERLKAIELDARLAGEFIEHHKHDVGDKFMELLKKSSEKRLGNGS